MKTTSPEPIVYQTTEKPAPIVRKLLDELDLGCVKFKLMDSAEGEGWTREKVERMEVLYKRFLFLTATNLDRPIIPTRDIDAFWHQHILDTRKYAEDCERIFGFFLHHFPYVGMRGEEDAKMLRRLFLETRDIYERTYGETYGADASDCENCGNCPSSCGVGSVDSNQVRPTLPALA